MATEPYVVETQWISLKDFSENGVRVFRGVPYAAPPVGDRRFNALTPMAPWSGVRDGSRSGPASYQTNTSNRDKVKAFTKSLNLGTEGIPPRPDYAEETYSQENASEDCLYLDIWVPEIQGTDLLPVYVYYHGGANGSSSGHYRLEDASNLGREEQIFVVRLTYREGLLGWGHFGLLTDLLAEVVNLRFQDQVAALRWFYDNIEAFGGDKQNLTVGGESAGATAVSDLLTYPETQPLIRRAIIQFMTPFHVWCTQEKENAVDIAQSCTQILQIDDPSDLLIIDPDCFLTVHNILVGYFDPDKNCAWRPVGPVIDGEFVPQHSVKYLSEAAYPRRDFELVLGMPKDEWQYSRGESKTVQHSTEREVQAVFAQGFGKTGLRTPYETYHELYPSYQPGHILGDIMSFEFFKFGELVIGRNFASRRFSVHVFQFSLDLPGYGGFLRAVHTGDTPYYLW